MSAPDANGWTLITDEAPPPNNLFDVVAKYYDASMDTFLMRRIADCVQVEGDIVVSVLVVGSGHELQCRIEDLGLRATHWRHIPDPPVQS